MRPVLTQPGRGRSSRASVEQLLAVHWLLACTGGANGSEEHLGSSSHVNLQSQFTTPVDTGAVAGLLDVQLAKETAKYCKGPRAWDDGDRFILTPAIHAKATSKPITGETTTVGARKTIVRYKCGCVKGRRYAPLVYNDSRGCKDKCDDGNAHCCDVLLAKTGAACGRKDHRRGEHRADSHGLPKYHQ